MTAKSFVFSYMYTICILPEQRGWSCSRVCNGVGLPPATLACRPERIMLHFSFKMLLSIAHEMHTLCLCCISSTGSHTYLALSSQLAIGSEGHTQFVWTFDEGPSLDSISSQSEVVCSTDVAVLVLEVAKSQHR